MQDRIRSTIADAVAEANRGPSATTWKEPLVAFADAADPLFDSIRDWNTPEHLLPGDLLPDPVSVITYFLPFDESIIRSNIGGRNCSREWGQAYIETNTLIGLINDAVSAMLAAEGYRSAVTPATHNFDPKELISHWSHRHVAYIAGLGTFGLNNMLITEAGCCGRIGSIVTSCPLPVTPRPKGEFCLFRRSGSCGVCAKRCVNEALSDSAFDRFACYEMCLENDRLHADLDLTDVCGKCLVKLPCSTRNPAAGRGA